MLELSFPSPINTSVLDDFYLLVDSDEHFLTIQELNTHQEAILNSILTSYNAVPGELQANVAAIKLFDFPADYNDQFPEAVRDLTFRLSAEMSEPFYYQSAFIKPNTSIASLDFISGRFSAEQDTLPMPVPVLLFEPSGDVSESLQRLESTLNQSLSYSESIIIIPADWFFARLDTQEGFSTIIRSYFNGSSISFPMPENKPQNPNLNWPIIFLVVIWGSFIIHYKYQPIYSASLPRYFFNHSFFVHDVMENRIRSSLPSIVVLIQHTLLTGLIFYLIADAFISKTGYQALVTHYPALFYPGFEPLSLIALGLFIAFFSHVISIAWLHVFNKNFQRLNQTINFYSWPLHINLIIVTLVLYFVQLSDAHNWLIVAAIAYFMVWFFSFTIAAIDGAKFLNKYRALYLF
ncbi:MAG: hypothetical protein R3220_09265 [Balneolaceae bacterium]|nr:hypothetical protein [Balneolaceae bacterium]